MSIPLIRLPVSPPHTAPDAPVPLRERNATPDGFAAFLTRGQDAAAQTQVASRAELKAAPDKPAAPAHAVRMAVSRAELLPSVSQGELRMAVAAPPPRKPSAPVVLANPAAELRRAALAVSTRQSLDASSAQAARVDPKQPGGLSARYESGNAADAIGFDGRGGTCYGLYQMSSRAGTVDNFIAWMEKKAPELARELKAAGPADTGSTQGAMPEAWQRVNEMSPKRFAKLQHDFISREFYGRALSLVRADGGPDLSRNPALRESLWSAAVQHGPQKAAGMFLSAAEEVRAELPDDAPGFDRKLIETVYAERAERFGSARKSIRASVARRLAQERDNALAMLEKNGIAST